MLWMKACSRRVFRWKEHYQRKFPRIFVGMCIICAFSLLLYTNGMIYFIVDTVTNVLTPRCVMLTDMGHVANMSCPIQFKGKDANETIIMTFATVGWYLLVGNWILSLKKTGIKGSIMVVSLDRKLCPKIQANATLREGVTCFEALHQTMYTDTDTELSSTHEFGSPSYKRIMHFRTQVIYSMVLCNRTLLLADVDVVFLRDPLQNLRATREASGTLRVNEQYDMLFQRESTNLKVLDYFENLTVHGRWFVCAGFIYMAPTKNTLHFWASIIKYQELDWNDQVGMNKCLILSRQIVNWKVLPSSLYRNGFYMQHDRTNWRLKNIIDGYFTKGNHRLAPLVPYMVHFNWIHGVTWKQEAMQRHGMWYFISPFEN